jgi:hypothetical protein
VLRVARAAEGPGLSVPAILLALRARGLSRILVEGGGVTVSRFLAAGCLDRLHLTVAPVILGSGVPAITLPPVASIAEGLRVAWTAHPIPPDMLFDLALDRAPAGAGAGPAAAARRRPREGGARPLDRRAAPGGDPRRGAARARPGPAAGARAALGRLARDGAAGLRGRVPESERARMRAPLQAGGFPFPVKYGYCAVGVVVEAGGPAAGRIGQRVFCLHPHQDLFLAPAAMCVPLPEPCPRPAPCWARTWRRR